MYKEWIIKLLDEFDDDEKIIRQVYTLLDLAAH